MLMIVDGPVVSGLHAEDIMESGTLVLFPIVDMHFNDMLMAALDPHREPTLPL